MKARKLLASSRPRSARQGRGQLTLQPYEELAQIALIGLERLVGVPALVCQVREPRADAIAQILSQRQLAVVEHVRQGRTAQVSVQAVHRTHPRPRRLNGR
jgi:hypothetical protein